MRRLALVLVSLSLVACTPAAAQPRRTPHHQRPEARPTQTLEDIYRYAQAVKAARYRKALAYMAALERQRKAREAAAKEGGDWQRWPWQPLAQCESGGRWNLNVGSFDGGLQFLPSTWTAYGGGRFAAFAYQASAGQQVTIAKKVLASQGWSAWPVCSRKIGARS